MVPKGAKQQGGSAGRFAGLRGEVARQGWLSSKSVQSRSTGLHGLAVGQGKAPRTACGRAHEKL